MRVSRNVVGNSWLIIMFAVTAGVMSFAFQADSLDHETESVFKDKWQDLFDGKTLNGWHALPGGTWTVEDGILVGRSDVKEERHGILMSDKEYRNFEIEVVFKAEKGNSGLYFRVEEIGGVYGVLGFQAEIHSEEYVGGLYETGGRQWVSQPKQEDVKNYNNPGDWNTMRVRAVDGDITVTVNGTTTAKLQNDPGRRQGRFGLQLHGGQEMLIMFKAVRIKELK